MQSLLINTLADLIVFISMSDLPSHIKRDLISAIKTLCEKLGRSPEEVPANAFELRLLLQTIRPAAHGIKPKTLSNLRSLIAFALKLAGQLDELPRGLAKRHKDWQGLMNALFLVDKPTGCALATFANWCAYKGFKPDDVTDLLLREFCSWLETRSLHPAPHDLVRQIPIAWERAQNKVENWPQNQLGRISFKAPQLRISWEELPERFRREAEAYLSQRKNPDLFDESDKAPTRPLASSTVRQQREHLRIAASILMRQHGVNPDRITLSHLVSPNSFKIVLRSLVNQAIEKNRRKLIAQGVQDPAILDAVPPNAFAICLAATLIQVGRYYVQVQPEELHALKKYNSKLKPVPFDLTEKNKQLLRQLEVPATQAKLMFLPELLQARVAKALQSGRLHFVDAQIALAIDLQLVLPLRPQNLHSLHWQRHFMDLGPDGLRLIIPAAETKSRKRDIVADIPAEVAQRIDWYRRNVLPKLGGSETGHLFVRQGGARKDQKTLAGQIINAIEMHVGVHMTPHQFRHFAAVLYLEKHPNDFETVRNLLGHAFSRTTAIYAGSSTKRAGIAYANFLFERKDELRICRAGKRRKSTLILAGSGA